MLKIQVKSVAVQLREGVSGKGKAYSINEQEAWLDLPNGERRKIKLSLEAKKPPYAVGDYALSPDSFMVDQYGQLSLGRITLQPIVAGATRATG
ncbi:MAG: single-stranded DNA-binding protein [Pseudomonadota bacterium]|nr:single-stranded DNA-binding protein [Pseudomonadota bacterium]